MRKKQKGSLPGLQGTPFILGNIHSVNIGSKRENIMTNTKSQRKSKINSKQVI
jgi:hypothetical protein